MKKFKNLTQKQKRIIVLITIIMIVLLIGSVVFLFFRQNTNTNSIPANACNIINADIIKQYLGLTVIEGAPSSSRFTNGTNCKFKGVNDSTVISLQVYPSSAEPYSTYSWTDIVELNNVGEKAFVEGPVIGASNAEALKNGNVIFLNIYSRQGYSQDQLKVLLKAIVDNLI